MDGSGKSYRKTGKIKIPGFRDEETGVYVAEPKEMKAIFDKHLHGIFNNGDQFDEFVQDMDKFLFGQRPAGFARDSMGHSQGNLSSLLSPS